MVVDEGPDLGGSGSRHVAWWGVGVGKALALVMEFSLVRDHQKAVPADAVVGYRGRV